MTIKRYLVIALAILPLTGCGLGGDDRLVLTKDPADASRFVCDVKFATFTTPKGWTASRSDKNTYAILTLSNETYPHLSQMISIDIGKPVEPTTRASADAFAMKWGGMVENASLSVDGEVGYRVVIPPDKITVRPIDCIVTMKNGRLFMIIGGARERGEVNAAINQLMDSWKWKN